MSKITELIDRLNEHADLLKEMGFEPDGMVMSDYKEAIETIQHLYTWHISRNENVLGAEQKANWVAADPNNLPDNKVIYELTDGRKGIGVLFEHEFPYDGLSVCAMDEISGNRHPFVGRWMPLPWEECE